MQQTRDVFRIPSICLARDSLQRALYLPGFHEHDIQSRLGQPAAKPLRERASFKSDSGEGAIKVPHAMRQRFWLAGHLHLSHNLPVLVDHTNGSFLKRH